MSIRQESKSSIVDAIRRVSEVSLRSSAENTSHAGPGGEAYELAPTQATKRRHGTPMKRKNSLVKKVRRISKRTGNMGRKLGLSEQKAKWLTALATIVGSIYLIRRRVGGLS